MRLRTFLKFVSLALLMVGEKTALAICNENGLKNKETCGNGETTFQPCKDFELVAGKATSDTTLWMLGEIHANKELTIKCVEKLTEKSGEHIIYLEGIEAGKKVKCEEKHFKNKPGRTCMGWDDMQAHQELLSFSPTQKLFNDYIVQECITKLDLMYKGKSDKEISQALTKMQKDYRTLKGKDAEKYHAPQMLKAIDSLITGYKKGSSFSNLFAKNKEEVPGQVLSRDQLKKIRELNHKRNTAQMKLLAKHPKNTLAISCTGLFHLVEDKESHDAQDSEYVRRELAKGQHQNPYAILALKQSQK